MSVPIAFLQREGGGRTNPLIHDPLLPSSQLYYKTTFYSASPKNENTTTLQIVAHERA